MAYLDFFGLKEDPFKLTPDPEFFYPSEIHRTGLGSMEYIAKQKEGFCVITGEPGTGKTTLIRKFIEDWRDKAEIALILTPQLNSHELFIAILEDLGVKCPGETKHDAIKKLRDYLLEKTAAQRPVLIFIDEAQDLPDDSLEELRLLSNIETNTEKLLQIILIGQPELEEKLRSHKLRQLNQRVSVKLELKPLSLEDTRQYINWRLTKAGKGSIEFRDSAIRSIHRYSKGTPRLINLIASRSIMSAWLKGDRVIRSTHVETAVESLNIEGIKKLRLGILLSILILLILALIYQRFL
ncbi:MAG: AAA family ATPase [Thermodesulfovibrionales bacterium]|nr:AAA family ATPase [Thermodesulfovibrionales bacterium]